MNSIRSSMKALSTSVNELKMSPFQGLKTLSKSLQSDVIGNKNASNEDKTEPRSRRSSGLQKISEQNRATIEPLSGLTDDDNITKTSFQQSIRSSITSALELAFRSVSGQPKSELKPSVRTQVETENPSSNFNANVLKQLKVEISLAKTTGEIEEIRKRVKSLDTEAKKYKEEVLNRDSHDQNHLNLVSTLAEFEKIKWLLTEKASVIEARNKLNEHKLENSISPEVMADKFYEEKWKAEGMNNPGDIIRKVSLKNSNITQQDLEDLRALAKLEEKDSQFNGLYLYAGALLKEIEDSIDRRSSQLKELVKVINATPPPSEVEIAQLKIQCHQMLHNPFELAIDSELIFNNLSIKESVCIQEILETKTSLSPAEILSAKREGLSRIREVNQKKVEEGKCERKVLISGGGPVGLTLALSTEIMGHKYQLIETRGRDQFTYQAELGRHNIIALGKDNDARALVMLSAQNRQKPADVEIMNFFGIRDELLISERAQEGALGLQDLDVEITDLQHSMLKALAILQGKVKPSEGEGITSKDKELDLSVKVDGHLETLMSLQSKIESLEMVEGKLQLTVNVRNEKTQVSPDVVFISEGAGSSTRSKLGIERKEISKTVKVAVGLFEKVDNNTKESEEIADTKSEILKSRVKLGKVMAKTIPQTIKAGLVDTMGITTRKIVDPMATFVKQTGRFVLLSQNMDKDYSYSSLTEAESKKLTALQQEASLINPKLRELEDIILEKCVTEGIMTKDEVRVFSKKRQDYATKNVPLRLAASEELLKAIEEKIGSTEDIKLVKKLIVNLRNNKEQEEELLKTVAEETRRFFKPVSKYVIGSFQEGKRKYMFSSPVDVQLTRAETNHVQMGNTSVVLAGDSASTTDPASGSGARTGILQAHIAQTTFLSPHLSANSSARGAASGSLSALTDSMREEGLAYRAKYNVGTEKTQRFVDLAVRNGVLSQKDGDEILMLKKMSKLNNEPISLDNIKNHIKKEIGLSGLDLNNKNPIKPTHLSGLPLKAEEKEVVASVLQRLINPTPNDSKFSKNEMDILRDVVGPWALDYRKGATNPKQASLIYLAGMALFLEGQTGNSSGRPI